MESVRNIFANEQKAIPQAVDILSTEFIKLLGNFGYEANNPRNFDEEKCRIVLFKNCDPEIDYPRLHIEISIPFHTCIPKIATFHIDDDKHTSRITVANIERKIVDINNMTKNLKEVKVKSKAENILLSLLECELLYGSSREISYTRGLTHDRRFQGLITNLPKGKLNFIRGQRQLKNAEEDLDYS